MYLYLYIFIKSLREENKKRLIIKRRMIANNQIKQLTVTNDDHITHNKNVIVDRIIDVQLMIKSLQRKAKTCDTEERVAKNKAKNAYKNGDVDTARILAEIAVRKRKESQHYQMLSARLSPVLMQLKDDFAGRSSGQDCTELQQLLKEVTALGQTDNFDVSQNEINTFIQNLNRDQSFQEPSFQVPTVNHVAELEQRLANLRRRSP